jgi:hypothetical protein
MTTAEMTRSAAPERSLAQRRDALRKANRIRTGRAGVKRALKAGLRDPITVLLHPTDEMATMKVYDLLVAMPKIGRVKANRALTICRISPSKTLGGMTDRQRDELAGVLGR